MFTYCLVSHCPGSGEWMEEGEFARLSLFLRLGPLDETLIAGVNPLCQLLPQRCQPLPSPVWVYPLLVGA